MSSAFGRRCVCGALIVTAVVGGIVHHDEQGHTETFRPDPAPVAAEAVGASTSSGGGASRGGLHPDPVVARFIVPPMSVGTPGT